MTFSLLARDPVTGALGVASQSHHPGAGAIVAWAEAGVGVVATQGFATRSYGPRGLALMRVGGSAADALSRLTHEDPRREIRQVAFLDAAGRSAFHSGRRCVGAVGVASGDHAVALGNMVASDDVVPALLAGFQGANGDFAHRLVAGLAHAEDAGGDIRGSRSAALVVVDGHPTDAPWDSVLRDLRVDDHSDPVGELRRLIDVNDAVGQVSRLVFPPSGGVLGDRAGTDFAGTAAKLADAHRVLNPNPQALFWSAVLHARWGRTTDARRLFTQASQLNPRLSRFLHYLCDAGLLTTEDVAPLHDN